MKKGECGQMPRYEKFIFAFADIFGGGGQSILAVIYLIYLTNILKISPVWAGTAILISKIVDAVVDPFIGVVSDNTRTRMGRRRPFLLIAGLSLPVAMALLWLPVELPTELAKIIFVAVSYPLYNVVSSCISVPYYSLSTEITTDYGERNRLNMLRLAFSTASTAVCTLVPSLLFERLTDGRMSLSAFYLTLVLGFGLAFALPQVLLSVFGRERAPYEREKTAFRFETFLRPFRVRSFRKLLGLYLCQAVTLDIVSAVILYYALYVVRGLSSTVFLGIFLGVQLLMYPVINVFINKVSKTRLYGIGLPFTFAGALMIALYPSSWPMAGLYAVTAVTALGFAGALSLSWVMFPDVVDIAELGLSERITGSMSGVMSFLRQASSAFAIFFVGLMLSLTGFIKPTDLDPVPAQPEAAVWGIRVIIGITFVGLMGFALWLSRTFRLTPAVSARVKHFLDAFHANTALTDAEREEQAALLKEFY